MRLVLLSEAPRGDFLAEDNISKTIFNAMMEQRDYEEQMIRSVLATTGYTIDELELTSYPVRADVDTETSFDVNTIHFQFKQRFTLSLKENGRVIFDSDPTQGE